MTAIIINEVHKGFYLDSVALMRLSRTIAGMAGVEEAALMMSTPANREIMADAGLLAEAGAAAGGGDLVIAIRAATDDAARSALAEAVAQLDKPAARGGSDEWRPRTLRAVVAEMPGANLALISVPGDFAVAEARKAIRRGLHAMIFSDNVGVGDEVALKHEARELGRLVMGPDCGTAIINGTPLAFANAVPCGGVGIIGASGTGIQEVTCLIAQAGGGISHAIGVGGRDLKSEVGGISTLMALDALDADPGTERIVLISKPPAAEVAATVLARIAESSKPATICFIGADRMDMPANAEQVFTLKAASCTALDLNPGEVAPPGLTIGAATGGKAILGLFSGGTLCAEAQVLFRAAGQPARSNAPISGIPGPNGDGHLLLDLGDDEYTRGKPHPMIDPTVRDGPVVEALGRTDLGAILLDVVIGYGAYADPAGHLAALMRNHARPGGAPVFASVTGTEDDPQVRTVQVGKLKAAGIHVAPSNADATLWALNAVRSET